MAKKIRLTVAPKKAAVSPKKLTASSKESEQDEKKKKKVYSPKVRLTAHIKRN